MVLVVVVAPCYGGRHIFIAAGRRDTSPCAGNSGGAAGNIHHPGGNALAKLKNMTGGQNASRRCARRLGGPNRNPFSVRASTQTDQDGPFASEGCVGPLEMPSGLVEHTEEMQLGFGHSAHLFICLCAAHTDGNGYPSSANLTGTRIK
jgi:hypothetical protein